MIQKSVNSEIAKVGRRTFISRFSATLATTLLAPNIAFTSQGKKKLDYKLSYTQAEVVKLHRDELKWIEQATWSKKKIEIRGFYILDAMQIVWPLLFLDRRAAQRLLRDMSKLKWREDRERRLKVELDRVQKFIKQLEEGVKQAKKRLDEDDTHINYRRWVNEKERLAENSNYAGRIEAWLVDPLMGTGK